VAVACPNCAHENPDEARFCSSCGTPLTGQTTVATPVEERRVVSILFADLAGFTSRSDHADPEDVRRTLIPFHSGNADAALDHIRAFDEATEGGPTEYRELQSPEIVRVCLANHDVELAGKIVGDRAVFVARTKDAVLTGRALLAEARGDTDDALALFQEAAAAWGTYGGPFERAHALAGAGRCLSSLGRDEEATRANLEARALFTALGVP
jgi:class 3 adenylate cyclase